MSTKKNTTKKVAAKAAAKVAAKVAKKEVAARRDVTVTIKLVGDKSAMRGKRAETLKRIKNGMTIEALQTAMVKYFKSDDWKRRTLQVIDAAVEKGVVTVQ